MQNDLIRVHHMLDAAHEIEQFIKDKARSSLDDDRMLLRALSMSMGIIGEAATHISSEFQEQHDEIPWQDIKGMRNFLFHAYFKVDADVLWDTATLDIPLLVAQLKNILPK